MITFTGPTKLNDLKAKQKAYQALHRPKAPFKRLVQNQPIDCYRYQIIEAYNELVTTLRDPNYHKPKHILVCGGAQLGKTYFMNKLIGILTFNFV